MRNYARSPQLLEEYSSLMIRLTDEELANLCITLIHQANYMLYRLLESLQKRFIEQGGIREQMTAVRKQYRSNQNNQSCQSNQKTQ